MAEKNVRRVAVRQRNGTLGDDYQLGLDFANVIDSDREKATGYTLKEFFDNYIDFQSNSYNNVFAENKPVNKHVGIWFDTGHNNQEFPTFKSVTFNGNGGTWTWGVVNETDSQTIEFLDTFRGSVPQDITKPNKIFLGWYVDEIDIWSRVDDILNYSIVDGMEFVAQWADATISAEQGKTATKGATVTIPINLEFIPEDPKMFLPDLNLDLSSDINITIDQNIGYTLSRQSNTLYNLIVSIPQTANTGDIFNIGIKLFDKETSSSVTVSE